MGQRDSGQRDWRQRNPDRPDNDKPGFGRRDSDKRDAGRPDFGRRDFGDRDRDRRDFGHRDLGRRDFHHFRGNFHADRRFHAGPWRPPRDYQYRRWSYGDRLPSLYFSPGLWITSFGLYGLMVPPPDTVWVRSGPDALLVDRYTGEIIRVQYGVFY